MTLNYIGLAPALEQGLEIIEYVSAQDKAVSFTDLEAKGTSRSTLNRLLKVLCGMGYLEKTQSGYVRGSKCNILGINTDIMEQLRIHSSDIIHNLCRQTGNTSILFYWNGTQTQVIAKDMSENSIGMQPVGNVSADFIKPPWGWILLDSLPDESGTVKRHRDLLKSKEYQNNIRFYRENGFALDRTDSLIRLACPVMLNDRIVAVLALGGNILTIAEDSIGEYGKLLSDSAKQLSNLLR